MTGSNGGWKTRTLAALQDRMRSLAQPLYNEQAALRQETSQMIRESLARIDKLESTVHALAESVLFSRLAEHPGALLTRLEAGHWLNWLGLGGEGVEVGVFQGEFSETLLRTWKGTRLTSIDPWQEFPAGDYVDVCNASQAQHDANHARATARLATFGGRSRIMRTTSAEAAREFGDGSLDFAYLDAQHHFEAVRDDIALWHPKIRHGGVIGGHDYIDGMRSSGLYGVKRAVDEFVASGNYELIVTREPNWPSWFVKVG